MGFLIGNDSPQTCDGIAHFVQRYMEVSAQDPMRTGDAGLFEQFTNCLLWTWDRYRELLYKWAGIVKAARAANLQRPVFVDACVVFMAQMISKSPAAQPYTPGVSLLPTPSAPPLRTSATHGSPSAQTEPVYVAHHAPYVLRAVLERSSPAREDRVPASIDARFFMTLVGGSRNDITKWRYPFLLLLLTFHRTSLIKI